MGMTNAEQPAVEEIEIPPFDFAGFFADQWWKFILIFVCLVIIYNKVFRTRKLPLLKDAVIYLTIAAGTFVLLILQVDAGLPIMQSLGVAVLLILIVRVRYYLIERRRAK